MIHSCMAIYTSQEFQQTIMSIPVAKSPTRWIGSAITRRLRLVPCEAGVMVKQNVQRRSAATLIARILAPTVPKGGALRAC